MLHPINSLIVQTAEKRTVLEKFYQPAS